MVLWVTPTTVSTPSTRSTTKISGGPAGTLGEKVLLYPHAFRKEVGRPTASVLDAQYDWERRYKGISNKISGFTKTEYDPEIVGAWQVLRGANGLVELR